MANYSHLLFVFVFFQLVRIITTFPALPSWSKYAREEVYPYSKYGALGIGNGLTSTLEESEFGGLSFFG